jgi:opacity protein-like surface antigen
MNRKILSAAVLAACTAPFSAFAANNISYNYIEAEYVVLDVDMYEDDDAFDNIIEDADDGDGFRIGGSYAFTNNLFIFGNYSQTKADFTFIGDTNLRVPADTDIKTLQVGLGYFTPINANLDFVVRAAYMDVDYDEFSLGQTDQDIGDDSVRDAWDDLNEDTSDGYFVDAGVRAQVIDWLELGGGVRYTDLDSGDDVSVFGNALFEINQNFGINLTASVGDNLSSYSLGFRYSL